MSKNVAIHDLLEAPAQAGVEASLDEVQRLVDRSLTFNVLATPDGDAGTPGGAGGHPRCLALHRLEIRMPPPVGGAIRASNAVGARIGSLEVGWTIVPYGATLFPGATPAGVALDPRSSQRFALTGGLLRLGGDSLQVFGTGRTFPFAVDGRAVLVAAAVANLERGTGRLAGVEGCLTLCGELDGERGFRGHVMFRLVDPTGALRTIDPLPAATPGSVDPGVTYLTWIARKGNGADQVNRFSFDRARNPRGVSIPVDLWQVDADADLVDGAIVGRRDVGPRLGLEIGFGRETQARNARSGSATSPYQFDGVSQYTFFDRDGRGVGTIRANFFEGRTFAMRIAELGGQPALRFGYFGSLTGAWGGLAGATGMLYGLGGSVFDPARPDRHVISNLYVARVFDVAGRFLG